VDEQKKWIDSLQRKEKRGGEREGLKERRGKENEKERE
jgi:hypothetical protein